MDQISIQGVIVYLFKNLDIYETHVNEKKYFKEYENTREMLIFSIDKLYEKSEYSEILIRYLSSPL